MLFYKGFSSREVEREFQWCTSHHLAHKTNAFCWLSESINSELISKQRFGRTEATFTLYQIAFRSDVKKHLSVLLGTLFSEELLQWRDVFRSASESCAFRIE
jgi:hypothetical protein